MKKQFILFCFICMSICGVAADMSNSMELSQLYIIGDATPYKWDVNATPEMERIADGVFRWTGQLESGREFKFINNRSFSKHIFGTACGQPVSAGNTYALTFVADWTLDGSKDFKFVPAATADYTIYVDLNTMMMSVNEKEDAVSLPATLYATGSALGGKIVELPLLGGSEFKATLTLSPGNVILIDTPEIGSTTTCYLPLFDGVDITFGDGYTSSLITSATPSSRQGWSVSLPGTYTIYALVENNNVFARFNQRYRELYIVGGCCPLGWNYWTDPQSIRFSASASSPEEVVWEGTLKPDWGESREEPNKFKILTAQDWFSINFHPYEADHTIIGESSYRSTGGPDVKWTISQPGYYRITINTVKETIRGELLSTESVLAEETDAKGSVSVVGEDKIGVGVSSSSVVVTAAETPADVVVTAISGQTVCKGRASAAHPFTSRPLVDGIYIVSVMNSNRTLCRKVAIK